MKSILKRKFLLPFIMILLVVFSILSIHYINNLTKLTIVKAVSIMQNNGATVVLTSTKTNQGLFPIDAQIVTVNDEQVYIYQYMDSDAASNEAASISSDGSTFSNGQKTTMFEWRKPPHFYKLHNLILLYLGSTINIQSILTKSFGKSFAENSATNINVTAFQEITVSLTPQETFFVSQQITKNQSGQSITLHIGDTINVNLGTEFPKLTFSDTSILKPIQTGSNTYLQGVYKAINKGRTKLSSQSHYPCEDNISRCYPADYLFVVTIIVE